MFDVKKTTEDLIKWVHDWFEVNGNGCNAVLGMSGGKDSTIAAAICVKALGADRVIGVMMPDKEQGLNEADKICEYLGIRCINAPISGITTAMSIMKHAFPKDKDAFEWSTQSEQNIPPRARMMMLYAISQTNNGRVVNTCNFSENYLGYATIFGDAAGDFSPLGNLTVTEILAIGDDLGLPKEWVHKTPDDGLPHSESDESKFGFTYETLDKYIRGIEIPSDEIKAKIDTMHERNLFKLRPMATFPNYVLVIE